jgi:hypothetical protein
MQREEAVSETTTREQIVETVRKAFDAHATQEIARVREESKGLVRRDGGREMCCAIVAEQMVDWIERQGWRDAAAQTRRADDAEARVERMRRALWKMRKSRHREYVDQMDNDTLKRPEFDCDEMPADWDDGTGIEGKDGEE